MKARLLALCLGCLVLVFSGCASVPTEPELKASLEQRAATYWKFRMEDKYEETYKMESGEGLSPFNDYLRKVSAIKKMDIVSHSIKDTKIDGLKAIVRVEISFRVPMIPSEHNKPFTQVIDDYWIYEAGRWLHQLHRN